MKILFMGTPEFAAEILKALASSRHTVCGAVCRADAPAGRGHRMLPPPVKEIALGLGIPVFQPAKLSRELFEETLVSLAPDVIAVAAYGRILPEYVLNYPKYGCLCVHGSVLPKYRGAAPFQRAIAAGEKEIGISIMKMDKGIDTGAVYKTRALRFENENCGAVAAALTRPAAEALLETLEELENGTAEAIPQNDAESSYAAKIGEADRIINFSESAEAISRLVRALCPEAPPRLSACGRLFKITEATVDASASEGAPGTLNRLGGKGTGGIYINCGEGVLCITKLVPEGKKEMTAGDCVRGRIITPDAVFVSDKTE